MKTEMVEADVAELQQLWRCRGCVVIIIIMTVGDAEDARVVIIIIMTVGDAEDAQ